MGLAMPAEILDPQRTAREATERLRAAAWAMVGLEADTLRLTSEKTRLESAAEGWRALVDISGVVAFAIDRQGMIHWLTPAATAILAAVPGPGQRLAEVACHLDGIDLEAEVRRAFDLGEPLERRVTAHGGAEAWLMRLVPYAAPDGAAAGVVACFRNACHLALAEAQVTLVEELRHRIRNMTQVVLSVANSTRRHATSLEDFGRSFTARILAMGRAQDLLAQSGPAGVPLRDLALRQLEPFAADAACLAVEGPALRLTAQAALAFDLVLHELATNAAKHGALSAAGGQVRLAWSEEAGPDGAGLVLRWTETGGPAVAPQPARRGFGTDLIGRQVRAALGGSVTVEFAAGGLRVVVGLPRGVLAQAAPPAAD
ncbi:hypothetical protein E2C06_28730 [Dankookia rubra]|uniref:histidine kinase n=1 Tax=Dankookia rubra TaxID=1442381 RepID=A0A4R5Q8R2_9PROT|nr:PAS domain-containing sensor histidine kinase [Dankookia rubra]TDH59166.1 hypothetical protein E2C06_28730 [Dankookia rubra]